MSALLLSLAGCLLAGLVLPAPAQFCRAGLFQICVIGILTSLLRIKYNGVRVRVCVSMCVAQSVHLFVSLSACALVFLSASPRDTWLRQGTHGI